MANPAVDMIRNAPDGDDLQRIPYRLAPNGRRVSPICEETHCSKLAAIQPTPKDVWVVTYPKCGTTWTQHLVAHLVGAGSMPLHQAFPWAEVGVIPLEVLAGNPTRMYKSHWWPSEHMAPDVPGRRVYVLRNAADVAVSLFHHTRGFAPYNFEGDWDTFFELFLAGHVDFDSWWVHASEWADVAGHSAVLSLTYEEMLEDTPAAVRQLAAFLSVEVTDERVAEVVAASSFNKMAANVDNTPPFPRRPGEPGFFRKGVAGDWRNYFSEEQHKRLMQKTREEFASHPKLLAYMEKHCGTL